LQQLLKTELPAVYGPPRGGDVRDSLADVSKAHRLLGYKGEVHLAEGLRRSIDWYSDNL
jgi:UDP-N-acetylglucosamine 4-epimerase